MVYERKISSEEAREGYVLVEKARLSLFPPSGERFEIDGRPVMVESYPCTCRGPDKPHEHWFIRLAGLTRGERVRLEQLEPGRFIRTSGP